MSEEAMRADFVGNTLQGYYRDGVTWTASFDEGGRYRVSEKELDAKELQAEGRWYFRGRAFCFLYGPPAWRLEKRCVAAVKIRANCYEFHLVWPSARLPFDERGLPAAATLALARLASGRASHLPRETYRLS